MAEIGTLTTGTYKWSSYSRYYKITLDCESQSIANNTSSVRVTVKSAGSGYIKETNAYIKINGSDAWRRSSSVNERRANETVYNDVLTLSHDSTGKLTFSFEFGTHLGGTDNGTRVGPTVTATGNFTLTTIPRQANITSAPDFTDVSNPTIYYSNPAGTAVSSLQACISLTGAADDISYRNIDKTGSSFTFSLSDAERNILRNAVSGSSKSTTVKFFVRTVIGGSTFHSTADRSFTITENSATKPTVSHAISGYDTFQGLIMQNLSYVKVNSSASGKYNASISSIYTTIVGKTYTGSSVTSDVFTSSGSIAITTTAIDSRGFSNSFTETINVTPYTRPYIAPIDGVGSVKCYRSDTVGNPLESSTRLRLQANVVYSTGNGNSAALQYRYRIANGSFGNWNNLTMSDYKFNANLDIDFLASTSYVVEIRCFDYVGSYSTPLSFDIPTEAVTFHMREGGMGVAVGKTSEKQAFECDLGAEFYSNVYVGKKPSVKLWEDTEGGNVEILSGNGHTNAWQMDAFDGNLRFYTFAESDGVCRGITMGQDARLYATMLTAAGPSGHVNLYEENSGGKIAINSGLGHTNEWGLDAYNGDFRVYNFRESDGAYKTLTMAQDGNLYTSNQGLLAGTGNLGTMLVVDRVTVSSDSIPASITAPTKANYYFFCWLNVMSNGFMGSPYIQDICNSTTNIWDVNNKTGYSYIAWALYLRTA